MDIQDSIGDFIKDFSKIVKPLSNLLNKDAVFKLDEECLTPFQTLKNSLLSAPIIVALDWSKEFELMCDVSGYAVGAVLGLQQNKVFHAIYYASKVLNDAQLNYATTEKEMLTIVYALEKFKSYLVGSRVFIFTDHAAIKYLFTKANSKPRPIRWVFLIQEFDIVIKDNKGSKNVVTDHFSKLVNEEVTQEDQEIRDEFPDESLLHVNDLGLQTLPTTKLQVLLQRTSIGISRRSSSMMLISMSGMIPIYSRLEQIIY